MSQSKPCPYCFEEIDVNARKCRHCLEFQDDRKPKSESLEKGENFRAKLEFLGKFILPAAVLTALMIFKPPIEGLLKTTESAEFLGLAISFAKTKGFEGDLTPLALHFLIGSADGGSIRYEKEKEKRAIDELQDRGLATLSIEEITEGSPEMLGAWIEIRPTQSGAVFLNEMGVSVTP